MTSIMSIVWNINPTILHLGPLQIRWYGLLYATTFAIGYYILLKIFRSESIDEEWADSVLLYMIIGTIIGARLGHCLFYDRSYYLSNPLEILMIWKGGLASHGGVIGNITALWIFSKKISKKPLLWITDRVAILVLLGGFLIRTGNLMNSEIIGKATTLPWGFEFVRATYAYPLVPRHPAQMYEAFYYLSLFIIILFLYWKKDASKKLGLLTGFFFTFTFLGRFLIEFLKIEQSAFEKSMFLNMGQILSIPLVIFFFFQHLLQPNRI